MRSRPAPEWWTTARASAPMEFLIRLWHILAYRRVLGLGAEGAFWLVFSLPWLLLGAVSILSLIDQLVPVDTVGSVENRAMKAAGTLLSPTVVEQYVQPIADQLFSGNRVDISILSFAVALWSGSRSIQTFVEANMIVNGQFRRRGYLAVRLLSIAILIAVTVLVAISAPLLVAGPTLVGGWLGLPSWVVSLLWGALALLLGLIVLTGVLHFSLPDRPRLVTSLPGAVLMVLGWWLGSWALGYYVARLLTNTSVYGVLAAPIAIMVYALLVSVVAFVAAAVNAALRGSDAGPESDPDADTQNADTVGLHAGE